MTILYILFITTSCERNWNNPYDPVCPTSYYTPYLYAVEQINISTVQLFWETSERNAYLVNERYIDGFYIERKSNNETWVKISNLIDNNTSTWLDRNIEPGTEYFYRIYAQAGINKSDYSQVISIYCPIQVPEVVTISVTKLDNTTISCSGQIISDGGSEITERGIDLSYNDWNYGLHLHPSESTSNTFSVTITDLEPNTTFYFRAYAINSQGEGYGNALTFQTD